MIQEALTRKVIEICKELDPRGRFELPKINGKSIPFSYDPEKNGFLEMGRAETPSEEWLRIMCREWWQHKIGFLTSKPRIVPGKGLTAMWMGLEVTVSVRDVQKAPWIRDAKNFAKNLECF